MSGYRTEVEIKRITAFDERYYPIKYKVKRGKKIITIDDDFPSVSTLLEVMPKGYGYDLFLMQKGKEAETIFSEAGELGDSVHHAIKHILLGDNLTQSAVVGFEDDDKNTPLIKEYYSLDAWKRIVAWGKWFREKKPETMFYEEKVYSIKHRYAGTLDYIGKIGNSLVIADWKTGSEIYEKYYLQIAAYAHAVIEMDPTLKINYAILLHLHPKRFFKNMYKEVLISAEDLAMYFEQFLFWQKVWYTVNKNPKPKYKTYPLELSLEFLTGSDQALYGEIDRVPYEIK